MQKTKSNQFCHDILNMRVPRRRATVNLVMALASFEQAHSLVEFSLSPVFHYQYSSIRDAIGELATGRRDRAKVQSLIQRLCLAHYAFEGDGPDRVVFQTDTSPVCKAHSPTLKHRTYVAVPNQMIRGNKPVGIGYEVSFVNLSEGTTKWSLPLSTQRVGVDQTASEKALEQIAQLLSHPDLGFGEKLCLNTLDSKYGHAAYLAPSWQYDNLVSIVRLRAGIKVWTRDRQSHTGGAPRVYGHKFYLNRQSRSQTYARHPKTKLPYQVWQPSVFEHPATEHLQLEGHTVKGRKLHIHLWRWPEMMLRSKKGHNMKDKPFDLLAVQVTDAQTGKRIFDRDMWLAISGQRKSQISTKEGYQFYRRRYDIEPFLRFSKQRLFLDKYQTSNVEYFDNWLLFNQLATWLLYTASDEAHFRPRKWRKYLPKNKAAHQQPRLSLAQSRKAAQDLFLTFEPQPFKPPKSKKGRPRQKGETQIQRTRYPVLKKSAGKHMNKLKSEKIE